MTSDPLNPREEFREKNLKQWKTFLFDLFPGTIPKSFEWKSISEILFVLNKIGSQYNMNHLFFPTGGGLDLTGAKSSYEEGCIELLFDELSYIVKPQSLCFESFGDEYEWAYFRLEADFLEPSGVYDELSRDLEELTEISPLEYVDRSIWDYGYYGTDEDGNEIPLPDTARTIIRFFSGSFVIFAKGSIYNRTSGTYDGRHNQMNSTEFRSHIEGVIEYLKDK